MEEFANIKKVQFSGKFPLILATADLKSARQVVMDVQVSRQPLSPYLSKKTNPPNGYYGSFCIVADGFVTQKFNIEFEKQRFIFEPSTDAQAIPAMGCILQTETDNLALVAQSLGVTVVKTPSAYYAALKPLFPDLANMLFQCYADTALSVTVQRLKYEICTPGNDPTPPPPRPIPTPPPTQTPPGTSIPPGSYTPAPPGSGGNYEPFPGDGANPPPVGGIECAKYKVTFIIRDIDNPNSDPEVRSEASVFGEIGALISEPNASSPGQYLIFLECGGLLTGGCMPGSKIQVATISGPNSTVVIDSVEEIP